MNVGVPNMEGFSSLSVVLENREWTNLLGLKDYFYLTRHSGVYLELHSFTYHLYPGISPLYLIGEDK